MGGRSGKGCTSEKPAAPCLMGRPQKALGGNPPAAQS